MSTQTARQNQPIARWTDGEQVTAFALVTKKERRQDKNGRDFLDLTLADASGSISGKVWSGAAAINSDFEAHDYVALKGTVKNFREQLQVSIQECRRVTDADRSHGFDEAKLIPSSPEDLDDLWDTLQTIYSEDLQNPILEQLAGWVLKEHGAALREHPAAKSIHHAYRGGLLEHTASMAKLAKDLCAHYPELDRDLVLIGVLFHDLGKLRELGAMPVNEYSLEGRLVGHIVIGRDLLREACSQIPEFPADLRLHLEHLVLSHQGLLEYSSPVVPKTPEAFVLHFIDDLDSKLNQLRGARARGPGLQWIGPLQRHVYFEANPSEDEKESKQDPDQPQQLRL